MNIDLMIVLDIMIKIILIYFIAMHGIYFVLMLLGSLEQKKYHQGIQFQILVILVGIQWSQVIWEGT